MVRNEIRSVFWFGIGIAVALILNAAFYSKVLH